LIGYAGADSLNGGAGTDRASYLFAGSGLTADLILTGANTGEAAGDTYTSIENLQGTKFDDDLRGNNGANELSGLNGNDILHGRGGDDTMRGGLGNDTFVFQDGFGTDTIEDFDALIAAEKIDLQAVSAITDFADLNSNHLSIAGSDTLITDGADTIRLKNVAIGDLDAGDFIF
ncbi:MAG TPA: calcium-binding protein, partial [Alphaproteobacteria bacterium]|nr:calcium-binding protein [Alphaproteobacteria bacterium]